MVFELAQGEVGAEAATCTRRNTLLPQDERSREVLPRTATGA
jgi:hypothetical protein